MATKFELFLENFMNEKVESLNEDTDLKPGDHFTHLNGYGTVTHVGKRDIKYATYSPEGEPTGGTGRINHNLGFRPHKLSVTPAEHYANSEKSEEEAKSRGLTQMSGGFYHDGKKVVAKLNDENGKIEAHDPSNGADAKLAHPADASLSAAQHRENRDLHKAAAKVHQSLASRTRQGDSKREEVSKHHQDLSDQHLKRAEFHGKQAVENWKKEQHASGKHELDQDLDYKGSSQASDQARLANEHRAAAKWHADRGNHEMAGKHAHRATLHQNVYDTAQAHDAALKALEDDRPSK